MKFIIQGDPTPQPRHRTKRRRAKGGRLKNINYDPASDQKELCKIYMRRFLKEDLNIIYRDFFLVSFTFHFSIPKSDSKSVREKKLSGDLQHTQKPDLDNLEKFYLDCMSGIFFSDDKKVVKLQSEKKWSLEGFTEIEVVGVNYKAWGNRL